MAEQDQTMKPLLTARDLLEMGEEGEFCELVDGELVKISPSFSPKARVVRTMLLPLGTFVSQHRWEGYPLFALNIPDEAVLV